MKLEDQVASLELSKKLNELEIKQNSIWYWCAEDNDYEKYSPRLYRMLPYSELPKYSAFTADELLNIIPFSIITKYNSKGNDEFDFCYKINIKVFKIYNDRASNFDDVYGVNYLSDTLQSKLNKENDIVWPVSWDTLFVHNIYDVKLSNTLAKTLIFLVENTEWKPQNFQER